MFSIAVARFTLMDIPYWLFSHRKTTGSFQIAARFNASWKIPSFAAPSPKKQRATLSCPRRLKAQPAPQAIPMLPRSEEHTSELQSRQYLVCRLLLEKKKKT